jgi:hypothetical protein
MHYTTKSKIWTQALHYHWPPKKSKILTHDHALHHHWPQKVKHSNPRPCTTPPLSPKKSNIRTHDHALHHHWPPKKSKDLKPRPLTQTSKIRTLNMHYTTIEPHKVKVLNPRPCTTPSLMSPKRQRFEPKTMHYAPLLTTSTDTSMAFMVIDDVTAHVSPKAPVWWDNVPFSQDRRENV